MSTSNSQQNPQGFAESAISFVKSVFNIRENVDKQRAREEILGSINFKGMPSLILIASIMVASIGLNANSVAVVIGAMLISPLMGPILGLGYSVAVNDWDTLKTSFVNFGIMVVISLLTSFIYFSLVPIKTLTEQLQGRIEPTSLDVLIAFFGGLAGIAALSSKIRNANIVAGVAIATALMPPLCTAGYGLSMGNEHIGFKDFTGFEAFINALYLFFINSIFIGISTYVFIRLNKFPLAKYQNAKQAKKTNWTIALIAVLTMIPSAFIFYGIIEDEIYKSKVNNFLKQEVEIAYPNTFFNIDSPTFSSNDSLQLITISTISERIPDNIINNWNLILKKKYSLFNTRLVIHQGTYDPSHIKQESEKFVSSIFSSSRIELQRKDSIISSLREQIKSLNSDTIPFKSISNELKRQYNNLDHFGYANFNYTNYKSGSAILPTFIVTWKDTPKTEEEKAKRIEDEKRVENFLRARLKLDTIQFLQE